MIRPLLLTPPPKVASVPSVGPVGFGTDEDATASPAEIAPVLVMPPAKADTVTDVTSTDALFALASAPAKMPSLPAKIVPMLAMPPEKVDIVTTVVEVPNCASAVPPARMPLSPAEIVPLL